MKKLLLFLVMLTSFSYSHAQNFVWAKQMMSSNMEGRSITLDVSGNVYTTGFFSGTVDFDPGSSVFNMTSFGSIDIFISKLDAAGNFLWAKQMGGTGGDDGMSIAVGATGSVYTTGRFSGTADFDPGPATVNLSGSGFISKLDASGNFVWAVVIPGEGKSIALDASENIYLASTGINTSTVSKLDANGNFIWTKTLAAAVGMPGAPTARGITVDNGNILIAGDFRGTVDFDPGTAVVNITALANGFTLGTPDIFVLKLDNTGNYLWVKRIGSDAEDFGLSIAVDASGNVHTTGTFRETADFDPGAGIANLTTIGLVDVFVSKLNTSGNFIWAKNFGGTLSGPGFFGHATTNAGSIAIDIGGNVHITGSFEGPGDPHPAGVATFGMSSFGDQDVFVVKLNTSGSVDWAKQLGGTLRDRGNDITVNSGGDVYTTGFFRGTADFDPGAGIYNLIGGGMFISKLGAGTDGDGDGYTVDQGDCDDNNAAVHPEATEVCNTIDDDCDGQVDEGVQLTFYQDIDGDTYGNAAVTTQACSVPAGYTTNSTDCNDNNAAVHPGATEVCNGIDDDCDGQVDEGVQSTFYRDLDGDTYGNPAVTTQACSVPAGYSVNNADCNDNNAAVHPGATEICNGVDDNCNGQIDEGVQSTFYRDLDSDTYGNPAITTQACSVPAGYSVNNTDCNDNNAAVHPGATEVCNGVDDDCDGLIDEGVQTTFYRDLDGDNYGNPAVTTQACSAPAGYTINNTDCNDNNAGVHPGATEVCNGIDDDCDGQVDEGVQSTFYRDLDGDNYGNPAVTTQACSAPSGYSANNTDCNDNNAAIHPGATEICNGIDDDCDGLIDEGGPVTFYRDLDGDGFGNPAVTTQSCSVPPGYTLNNTDCNDNNAAVHPGATEVCNGVDDDCDGQVDEGVRLTFYRDLDGDTYGNPNVTIQACTVPAGYRTNNTDCNDNNAAVHPGATEVCNGIDDDCDGLVDEGSTIIATITPAGIVNVCRGSSILLQANTGSGLIYQWLRNRRIIPGETSSTLLVSANGRYSVRVTRIGCGTAVSAETTIDLVAPPNARIRYRGRTDICANGSLLLRANNVNGGTYQWNRDGSPISGASQQTYTATVAGSYTVTITRNGCATTSDPVVITNSCVPRMITTDQQIPGTPLTGEFKIYPNPSTGQFNISLDLDEQKGYPALIQVINMQGQIVLNKTVPLDYGFLEKQFFMPFGSAPGIYLVRIKVGEKVFNSKLLLTK